MGDRIRVLWVIKTLGRGGAETLLSNLAHHLDHSRVQIDCAYADPRWNDFVDDLRSTGVRVIPLFQVGRATSWPGRLFALVRRGNYDVVHSHSPLLAAISRIAVLSCFGRGRPIHLSTEHNRRDSHHPMTRTLNRLTGPIDTMCIAVSEGVRRTIHGRLARRTVVKYQGIDLSVLERAAGHCEDRDPQDCVLRILSVGNLRDQKGFPDLFNACVDLQSEGLDFHLDIAGETLGPDAPRIQLIPDQLGIAQRTTFLGPRDDVPRLMRTHDVLVISSLYEGFPIVALEAAAIGLPIVATRVIEELFTDGINCLMVEVGDTKSLARAISRVAADRELAGFLSTNAKDLVAQLGIERTAADLYSTYSDLILRR